MGKASDDRGRTNEELCHSEKAIFTSTNERANSFPNFAPGSSRSPGRFLAQSGRTQAQNLSSGGGLYIPGSGGLIFGPPPSTGIPLFIYNALSPPSFTSGTCQTTVVGESYDDADYDSEEIEIEVEVVVTDDEGGGASEGEEEEVEVEEFEEDAADNGGAPAPPLPAWAFGPGGDPSRNANGSQSAASAPKPLVIPQEGK